MSIDYDWYTNDKRVIRIVFGKDWTWDEYLAIQAALFAMIDTVNQPVHYLLDVSKSRSLPLGALNKLPAIFSQSHPYRGKTIVFGASSVVRNVWDLLRKVIPQMREPRYLFVASVNEAEALLQTWQNIGQSSLANPAKKDENQV